jgi:hypothetical protein
MPTWVLGILAGVALTVVSDEVTAWLDLIPHVLLRAASLLLPKPRRAELYRDWNADLAAELADKSEPRINQLYYGIKFLRRDGA